MYLRRATALRSPETAIVAGRGRKVSNQLQALP